MHMAVQAMHDEGITVEQIRECNARAPFREATLECLRMAHRQGAHVVILSDANTL
jgi:phosphoserine phosphatase